MRREEVCVSPLSSLLSKALGAIDTVTVDKEFKPGEAYPRKGCAG